MLALCQNHPDFESINENESTDKMGVCVVKRKGMEAQRREFTVENAQKAGLWCKQGPWQTSPARMLKLRARAFALRDTFADALRGLQSAEEQRDIVETTATVITQPKRLETTAAPSSDAGTSHTVQSAEPPKNDAPVEATVNIYEVKKFNDGHFDISDSEGVVYSTTDESLAKVARDAKGKQAVILFQPSEGKAPVLVECLPVVPK